MRANWPIGWQRNSAPNRRNLILASWPSILGAQRNTSPSRGRMLPHKNQAWCRFRAGDFIGSAVRPTKVPPSASRTRAWPAIMCWPTSISVKEVKIDPTSGGIRSVRDRRHRGNRMSQQLALRVPAHSATGEDGWPNPGEDADYSSMVADQVETTLANSAVGEITSRGRLVDQAGLRLAGF